MGLVGAGFVSARLARRIPPRRTVTAAVCVLLTMSAALLALAAGSAPPVFLAVPIFFASTSVGFIMGNTTSLALAEVGLAAGSGSAVLGGGQFFAGALVSPLTGLAGKESAVPLAVIMTLSALVAAGALIATRTRSAAGR
jgi:DHA1 family bicyclomycin/chloramphenicol resistance-like MFS transporter